MHDNSSMIAGLRTAGSATRMLGVSRNDIAAAADCLQNGGLVAFPTETVYGLGADASNAAAVARLYEAKGRPSFNPLIAHVSDLESARKLADFDAQAEALAQAFWPGPLTLVLRKADDCPIAYLATAGLDSVAVRVPAHPVARELLRAFGGAVVAPSANLSGMVSPTTAAHVRGDLDGRIDLILDGGPVRIGVESTIIGCLGSPVLLRPGGVPRQAIEATLGLALASPLPEQDDDRPLLAPGMMASHYAPRTPVRLAADRVQPGEALLAFGPNPLPGSNAAAAVLNLSVDGNLTEAATNLFGYLRALDARGASRIAVMAVPEHGLGEAINDRLRRAAAPR